MTTALPSKYGFTTAQKETSAKSNSWAHFVAGGVGGFTAAVLTAPLDVLKTRLQSDLYQSQVAVAASQRGAQLSQSFSPFRHSLFVHLRETFQILLTINRVEGWRALFKGLGPNLTGIVPASAIKFYTYGTCKQLISERLNNGREGAWVHLLAAATAGVTVSTVTNPLWVVKTRLQLDKSHANKTGGVTRQYKNSLDCTLQLVRNEGIGSLYRGLTASYLGVSESTLQWVVYEQMKMYLAKREEKRILAGKERTTWDHTVQSLGKAGAAGAAKLFAAVITYPHEVVRTRLRQAPMEDGRQKYTGLLRTFGLIWREGGLASLYGGLTPHLLRVVPSSAIMFGTYEIILKIL